VREEREEERERKVSGDEGSKRSIGWRKWVDFVSSISQPIFASWIALGVMPNKLCSVCGSTFDDRRRTNS